VDSTNLQHSSWEIWNDAEEVVLSVLMIPILVGIAYVIPKYQFEKMSRESIVERIRKE
jgi:hypothetical protein